MDHKRQTTITTFFEKNGKTMKRIAYLIGTLCIFLMIAGTSFAGDVYVRGHYRSDGTYVQPHYRTAPDSNPFNNYSSRGNINPYTGKRGYKNPYSSPYYSAPRATSPYSSYSSPSRDSGYRNNYGNNSGYNLFD